MSQVTISPSQSEAALNETLTLAQIEARYPDEWVLIADPERDDSEIIRGRVVAHSPDRAGVHREAMRRNPPFCAFHFTGELPEFLSLHW